MSFAKYPDEITLTSEGTFLLNGTNMAPQETISMLKALKFRTQTSLWSHIFLSSLMILEYLNLINLSNFSICTLLKTSRIVHMKFQ